MVLLKSLCDIELEGVPEFLIQLKFSDFPQPLPLIRRTPPKRDFRRVLSRNHAKIILARLAPGYTGLILRQLGCNNL